ncbi:arylsulfotransferase family protein, partial [Candidatus Pelagibacter ubique]|nr:arylsulfotransferase family protein [Candidatus Pelagibacter ubique]
TIDKNLDFNKLKSSYEFKNSYKKKGFKIYQNNKVKKDFGLLVLSRYDPDKKKSVVEIIDLQNLKKHFTYDFDIQKYNSLYSEDKKFKNMTNERFRIIHPFIKDDGSIVFQDTSPLFNLGKCGELIWINKEYHFHHSLNNYDKDHMIGIAKFIPYSDFVKKKYLDNNFNDDGYLIIRKKDGQIIQKESIVEILYNNGLVGDNFFSSHDPIHLNDVEVAKKDTKFWKKGDLFFSGKFLSAIVHYRPSTKKVINFIKGPFSGQHDINFYDNSKLIFFNNNNYGGDTKNSQILIYDFDNKKFTDLLKAGKSDLKDLKSINQGLLEINKANNNYLIEEQNFGRLIYLDANNKIIWEYINKSTDKKIYFLNWSGLITDTKTVNNLKKIFKNSQCKK